jgi:hypothetical protein
MQTGSGIFLTPDLGWKNSDPGSGINILDSPYCFKQVFRNHDILRRIRILRSVHWITDTNLALSVSGLRDTK